MILYYEYCEFSLNAVAMATQQISMFHHCKTNCCNSSPHVQIFPKFHMIDKSPNKELNTTSSVHYVVLESTH